MKLKNITKLFIITLITVTSININALSAEDLQPKTKALFVVDKSVYPVIKANLEKYIDAIRWEFGVELKVLADDFYAKKPAEIRAILKHEYETSAIPVVGVIFAGPIPHAVLSGKGAAAEMKNLDKLIFEAEKAGDTKKVREYRGKRPTFTPSPYFYEDFDAVWFDEDDDGVFERFDTNRETNRTEIWTAWWVPPSNNSAEQAKMLNSYLKKLDRYHHNKINGKNGMIFIAGNGNSVEITEAWTVLMNGAMESTGNKVTYVASKHAQMAEKVLPKHAEEFFPEDLVKPITSKKWQHIHTLTHGDPAGFYWENAAVTVNNLSMFSFHRRGANIFTTAGCSNGNFRGRNQGAPDYTMSIANRLIFSDSTITVTYYGAASPQSTGVFAMYHTELFEALDPEKGSYIAEGYYNMINSDYSWGTDHYCFRGYDGKILNGDPFARYHK